MSGAIKFLIAAFIAYAGYALWQKHNERVEAAAIAAVTDSHGFIEFDPPNGGKRDSVIIVAAQNCPHEAAQHADALAREMAERNVRHVRTSSITFTLSPDSGEAYIARHNHVMSGDLPLVFVNGRVKSNPDVDDVLAEYDEANR